MLTGPQVRAARSLIGMKQTELAEAAGVSTPTIKAVEAQNGPVSANTKTIARIQAALEKAGIQFIGVEEASDKGGPGVRLSIYQRTLFEP